MYIRLIPSSEEKLLKFVTENKIRAEHLTYEKSIHTVQECVEVTGIPIEYITKCVIMIKDGKCIAGLVQAKNRVSTSRVGKVLNIEPPQVATPEETLRLTGYAVGGIPYIGYDALRLVDKKILDLEFVFTGGGSDKSLLKLWTSEIVKGDPIIDRIRK